LAQVVSAQASIGKDPGLSCLQRVGTMWQYFNTIRLTHSKQVVCKQSPELASKQAPEIEESSKSLSSSGEFSVTLPLPVGANQRIGCSMTPVDGKNLRITRIDSDGPVWKWNRENADREIRIGDCITEVDGTSGEATSTQMLGQLKKARKVVKLRLQPRSAADIEALYQLLQTRDLTPEDFELLALLDNAVANESPDAAAKESLIDFLPRVCASDSRCGTSECAVCLSDFEDNQLVTQLPCRHCFCTGCIASWLSQRPQCPYCLASVNLDEVGADIDEGFSGKGVLSGSLHRTSPSATKYKEFSRPVVSL